MENENNQPTQLTVKILDIDRDKIEAVLRAPKARLVFNNVLTKTLMFDHPQLRLRQNGQILRLRQVGSKAFLSIKAGPSPLASNPFHRVQESELVVDDFTTCFRLLESLGYEA